MLYDDGGFGTRQQSSSITLILVSFFLALALEFVPWPAIVQQYRPLFPALALVYWVLHGSQWVGYTVAVALGIILDLSSQAPMGFNVASFSVVVFMTYLFSRRFALFGDFVQALHVFIILVFGQITIFLLGWLDTSTLQSLGWRFFVPSMSAGLLWLLLPLFMRKLREFISGRASAND